MFQDPPTYQNSGCFSELINDYLDQKPSISKWYNRFPELSNFEAQIAEKLKNYSKENRTVLVNSLKKQYQKFDISDSISININLLAKDNTFTITTGHQLNLFSGPVYFLYKIISTINLCKQLRLRYPNHHFVPIYWMATEDHDFEEINFFNFKEKKIYWNKTSSGAVGQGSTEGLKAVLEVFSEHLGQSENANYLKKLFENAYLKHDNLTDATRYFVTQLFANQGLVIIDGQDSSLKKMFSNVIIDELSNQTSFEKVTNTIAALQPYKIQVNPREINLFYLQKNSRERIVFEDGNFKINNTTIIYSLSEILELAINNPENFSPNVILRPLYQEQILPNLCYIGGGGEIAYWLQLKTVFESHNTTFPMLLLRNSVVVASEKQLEKARKLSLSMTDLFMKQEALILIKTKEISPQLHHFEDLKAQLKIQFENLYQIVATTDSSFLGAVKAQESKQINGLEKLEKRFLKAQKRHFSQQLQQIRVLQNELFPNQNLQERHLNFSEFYLEMGPKFIAQLLEKLEPLSQKFTIIEI